MLPAVAGMAMKEEISRLLTFPLSDAWLTIGELASKACIDQVLLDFQVNDVLTPMRDMIKEELELTPEMRP